MFNLKNFLLSSSILFSVFSSPVFSNPKVLKVGAIPDQNQDVFCLLYTSDADDDP